MSDEKKETDAPANGATGQASTTSESTPDQLGSVGGGFYVLPEKGDEVAVRSPRDPASGLPTGKR